MPLLRQGFHKTRFAPTPSGFLHLGNVLSFALTAWLAELSGAKLLLRIDDLDRDRARPEYLNDIFETLHFLRFSWQEGPADPAQFEAAWSQLHRGEQYRRALDALASTGRVFACNCSRTEIGEGAYPGTCRHKNIPLDQPGVSWRIATDPAKNIRMKTLGGELVEAALPGAMQDFVIRKKDGHASYQLASLCDDIYFGIDLVVRGEDLLDSTIAQLYLAQELGENSINETVFFHHPLLQQEGRKLSKSAGDTSVQFLRKEGMSAEAIFNRIGEMAGLQWDIGDWRSLAASFLDK